MSDLNLRNAISEFQFWASEMLSKKDGEYLLQEIKEFDIRLKKIEARLDNIETFIPPSNIIDQNMTQILRPKED